MKFFSCFSGIEAASAAWLPLGWNCVGIAENEAFPCAVLAHHYPDVPNLGDVTAADFIARVMALRPDALVGGPPCQDFSVAGLRAGVDGHRGNLSLRWVELIRAVRPLFAVTENVPGWLSVNDGHAFGAFLSGLVGHDTDLLPPRKCGGRWTNAGMVAGPRGRAAWRILDAQHFGLAQRRRRVFVVFCPTDGPDPAAVLFEPASLRGHPAPRREAREVSPARAAFGISPDCFDRDGEGAGGTAGERSGLGVDYEVAYALRAKRAGGVAAFGGNNTAGPIDVATACNAHGGPMGRMDFESETFVTHSLVPTPILDGAKGRTDKRGSRDGSAVGNPGDPMFTLRDGSAHAVAFDWQNSAGAPNSENTFMTLCGDRSPAVMTSAVRRLTPRECERLQGFADDYTLIPYRGKPASDGPRYKALGNSMAVPVMAWIGRRIMLANS